MSRALPLHWMVTVALVAAACVDSSSVHGPPPTPRPGLTVINDPAELARRVTARGGAPVALESAPGTGTAAITGAPVATFWRLADVAAPVVHGRRVAATHVAVQGTLAYVAYATPGEPYGGAVDVFDVSSPDRPVLVSSARFDDTDVHALAVTPAALYLATGTSAPGFAAPAVLEVIALRDGRLTTDSRRVSVPSFAATGVAVEGTSVWVTSGTGRASVGGLTVLDQATLSPRWFDALDDARSVAPNGPVMMVVQGTPGRARLYATGALPVALRTFDIGGLSTPEAKAHVASVANWAVVAAGDGGPVVTRIRESGVPTGTRLFSVGRPLLAGVDTTDAVTNGVAIADDLLYSANGGAGVWVAVGTWGKTAEADVPQVTPLGRLALEGVSSNLVATAGTTLLVATGSGLTLVKFLRP